MRPRPRACWRRRLRAARRSRCRRRSKTSAARLAGRFGQDAVRAAVCDVTDEASGAAAFAARAREFGGLDILVANAGLASVGADRGDHASSCGARNYDVLVEGYFLTARGGLPADEARRAGGSIVFIGSKNALAATPNASAYASAKAAAAAPRPLPRAGRRRVTASASTS